MAKPTKAKVDAGGPATAEAGATWPSGADATDLSLNIPIVKPIESLTDVLARAEAAQLGKQELNPTPPANLSDGQKGELGYQWFKAFDEADYPKGVATLDADTYRCVELCARHFRNRLGLGLQWTSSHSFKYRGVAIRKA